jgi:hypothetical protein
LLVGVAVIVYFRKWYCEKYETAAKIKYVTNSIIMDKSILLIIQISIFILSIQYFRWTENKRLKTTIALYSLSFSFFFIFKLIHIPSLISMLISLFFLISFLVAISIHIAKTKTYSNLIKRMFWTILIYVYITLLFKVFHLPFSIALKSLSIIPLSFIVYLNYKKNNEIREELRVFDLIGILIILDVISFMYKNI